MTRWCKVALLVLLLWTSIPVGAKATIPSEPDTEAFLSANFHLQNQYTGVRCVRQTGVSTCPAQITATVPCLLQSCSHPSVTYPVSATYTTIQAAANAAQPGELIAIMPGRYAGIDVEDMGGANNAYIHFLGIGNLGDIVVDRSADPTKPWLRHWFYFIDTHYYIIQNIAFSGSTSGAGIFFSGFFSDTGHFSDHMVVMNVYSHDNFKWGLHTTSTNFIVVQDSAFTNSADEHGAYISGSGDDVLIRRNIFQGNHASGLQVNADPQTATAEVFYWLQNSTGNTCGWTEADVDFTGEATWDDIKACYDSQGLPDLGSAFEDGVSERLIIEQNVITHNGTAGGAGINLASVRDSDVRNNLVYGNSAGGIACWDNDYANDKGLTSSNFGCHDVRIYNNTLVDQTGTRASMVLTHDASNMVVRNNIIVRPRSDAYEVSVNSGQGLVSGCNYYYAQEIDSSPPFTGDVGSITGFTIPQALAQFSNPNFQNWLVTSGEGYTLNATRPDFHPASSSVLINSATTTGAPIYDITGSTRTGDSAAAGCG